MGARSSWPRSPTPRTPLRKSPQGTWPSRISRKRTTRRRSIGSGPRSPATRSMPILISASRMLSSPPAEPKRRWSSSKRASRKRPPIPAFSRATARCCSRRDASRTRGRSSIPRFRRILPASAGAARPKCSRASRSRPGSESLPYLLILERLLAAVSGARAALLLDPNGEVVVEAGTKDVRHRLIGAYQGIALSTARRATASHDVGLIAQFCCRYAEGAVVLTALKDDYYLIVLLAPEASLAVGLWHSA